MGECRTMLFFPPYRVDVCTSLVGNLRCQRGQGAEGGAAVGTAGSVNDGSGG